MKKGLLITLGVIVAVLVLIVLPIISSYNGLVSMQTNVEGKQAAIQTQLQRRADLIPNFVATVKGYSDYEQSTLTAVTEARASVGQAKTAAEQSAASEQLDKAISVWVNAVTEAYPDLKANTQYTALQDELAGTENRIAVARNDYNTAAQQYNTAIRRFPKNLIAGIFGFEKADYFQGGLRHGAGADGIVLMRRRTITLRAAAAAASGLALPAARPRCGQGRLAGGNRPFFCQRLCRHPVRCRRPDGL